MDLNLTDFTPVHDVSCFDNVAQHVPLKLSPLTPAKYVASSLQHCIYCMIILVVSNKYVKIFGVAHWLEVSKESESVK